MMQLTKDTNLRRDANQDHPLSIRVDAVVDDLATRQVCVSIKDLGGSRFSFDRPVVNCRSGDHTNGLDIDPMPKDNVLMHNMRLELGLHFQVEHLQLTSSCGPKNISIPF
jgi:hypothetical protein